MTQARIITVFNEKGGAGKTTLSCNLAHSLTLRGFSVQLLDLDGQRAATQWATATRPPKYPKFGATVWSGDMHTAEQLADEVSKFADLYDIIVADCAPSVENESTWAMLTASDLALIPTKLSKIDMDALAQAKVLARNALKRLSHPYPVRVVAMGARPHLNDDDHYIKQLQKDKEFPLLPVMFGFRQAFPRSRNIGSSVHALGVPEATRELEGVTDHVLKLIELPAEKKGRAAA
ncbi:ParA family protein [Hydrogenophaga borbori]